MKLLQNLLRQAEPQKNIPILMYHGFTDQKKSQGIENYHGKHLYVEKFEEQISYLKRHYNIISLARLVDAYKNGTELPLRSVLITFDDGYASNYHLAYPVLKKYQAVAAIFIATDFVGKKYFLWVDRIEYCITQTAQKELRINFEDKECVYSLATDALKKKTNSEIKKKLKKMSAQDCASIVNAIESKLQAKLSFNSSVPAMYLPITPAQIKEMVDSNLVTIGSHTSSHVIMTACSIEEMRTELEKSKMRLEKITGRPCKLFSYPNGELRDFNNDSKRILKDKGFRCALTTVVGVNNFLDDIFELKRLNIHNDGDFTGFVFTLSSVMRFLRRIKNASFYGD